MTTGPGATLPATIQAADYACVPIAGNLGKAIEIGMWANGEGFKNYEHALVYLGYFHQTPVTVRKVPMRGSGPGHWVAEAAPGGARLRRLDFAPQDYPGAAWSSGRLPFTLTPADRTAIVGFAFQYLGTPYSGLDYAYLAAHRLDLGPVDPWLAARIKSDGHLICSQYVDQCYMLAGKNLFKDHRWQGDVTPMSLENILLPVAA